MAARPGADRDGQQLAWPDGAPKRREEQHVVVRVARLTGLETAGNRMLPVDVDAVELRIGVRKSAHESRERLPSVLGGGHFVERAGVGPSANRQEELQVRVLVLHAARSDGTGRVRSRLATVARIDLIDRDGGDSTSAGCPADLAEGVVHVRELVGGNVGERIPFGRPVGVIAHNFQRYRRVL